MRQERHVNDTESTLNGGINDSVTSLTLTDGSGFPSEGDFRLIIESELLLATARSGHVLTVERGIENTTPAAHVDDKSVKVIVTEGSLKQFWSDFAPLYTPDSTPPKRLYDTSDVPIGESSFTWFNQGAATATDLDDNSILLRTPTASTTSWRGKYVTPPSTPWTITAAFSFLWLAHDVAGYPNCGLTVENSGDGKLVSFELHAKLSNSPGIQLSKLNSYTAFNSSYMALLPLGTQSELIWQRITNDGVNRKYYLSVDGVNWLLIYTTTYDDFITNGGDRVGFGQDAAFNDTLTIDHLTYLKHWSWS